MYVRSCCRNLGFDGTILHSNIHESMDLLNISSIKEAIASKELIIWPWVRSAVGFGCDLDVIP
jgi:hypothetical protein